ncbi:MAG: amidase [Chloroflexi bacterium]|nr:amidase [Chloroflexota bacterium]
MEPSDLTLATASEIAEAVRQKSVSPVEVTAHFLDRIAALDGELNAFITVAAEDAMTQAHRAEEAVIAGEVLGPLHGVPIGIKDLDATKGIRTTYGSMLTRDLIPGHDEIAVERIRAAGAIIVGKTNTPDFGWKGTTENLLTAPCANPWDTTRTSGGSSGGSASAVAAHLVPIANGSDAGGSIRIPASYCGIYGIKPTHGRVPRLLAPGAWRPLSQGGPMASNVRDAAVLLSVLAGADPRDPTCIRSLPPAYEDALDDLSLGGLRIAWSPAMDDQPVDPEVRDATAAAARAFEGFGAAVEEASPEVTTDDAVWIYATLSLTGLAARLGPTIDEGQAEMLPPRLLEWVSEALTWPATRHAEALGKLEWHRRRFADLFESYDLLLLPTMATTAFPIEQNPSSIDGRRVHPSWGFTPFCHHANLTGRPAASIPCGFDADGLPIGLQIVGQPGDEVTVLRASAAYEAAHPWAGRQPARFR